MFKRLAGSVGARLILAYLIIAALAVTGTVLGYAQIRRVGDMLAFQAMEQAEARYLSTKTRVSVLEIAVLVSRVEAADSADEVMRLRTQYEDEVLAMEELFRQLGRHTAGSARDERIFAMIRGLLDNYLADAQDVFRAQELDPTGEQTAAALRSLDRSRALLLDQLASFEDQQTSRLYSARTVARETVQRAMGFMIGLAVVSVAGGAALGLWVYQAITRPVGQLVQAARRIAGGELGEPIQVRGGGEIGLLARTFHDMALQLRRLIEELESRVEQRTRELEQRSSYLEASAEVGRAASSILDRDQLIRQVVDLIRERFDLYYVGLFLVDESGEWAVLRAGTGDAGRAMLARGHRIKVGSGMVGWAVANAQSRIALDVGKDAVRLATAELPNTRSEAALPLRSRGRVIGALTVQSDRPAAFDEATVVVLQTMADQVAVALDNARLFAEAEEALEVAQRAYGEMSRRAWRQALRIRRGVGYRIGEAGMTRLEEEDVAAWRPETRRALETGQPVQSGDGAAGAPRLLALPIHVRGETVAVLELARPAEEGEWTPDEVTHLQTLADQLGVALENARLLEETRQRAQQERIIADITARVRASQDLETILRTAVQELGAVLGTDRALIQLSGLPTAREGSVVQEVEE